MLIGAPVGAVIASLCTHLWNVLWWTWPVILGCLPGFVWWCLYQCMRYQERNAALSLLRPGTGTTSLPRPMMTHAQAILYGIKAGVIDPRSPEGQAALEEMCRLPLA